LSVVRSKLVAVKVGPVGLGIVAEVLQLLTLAGVIATVASGPALLKWLSEAVRDKDAPRLSRGLGTALVLAGGVSALTGLACVAAGPWIFPSDWPINARLAIGLTAVSVGLSAMTGCLLQVHVAYGDLRAISLSSIIGGLLATAVLVGMVLTLGLDGQFIALALGSVVSLGVTASMLRRPRAVPVRLRLAWDSEFAKLAFTVGTTSLVSGYVMQGLLSSIRWILEHEGTGTQGTLNNGNFQAAYAIGTTYFSAILSGVGYYFFPRYAAAQTAKDLEGEVHSAADFVLRYTPVLAFLAIAFRDVIIHLLYSDRFALASDMLGFMLAADITKAVSWSYAGPLPMRGKVRAFIVTESMAIVLGVPLVWCAIKLLGPVGVGAGMLANSACYSVVAAYVTHRSCGIEIKTTQLLRGISLAAGAAAYCVLMNHWSWLRWATLPILVLWAAKTGLLASARKTLLRWAKRLRQVLTPQQG
jgi:O-antigen/teichoic acid export membrane protein